MGIAHHETSSAHGKLGGQRPPYLLRTNPPRPLTPAPGLRTRDPAGLPFGAGYPYAHGMNRIERIFEQHRAAGSRALMPFLTAGDPDLATTASMLAAIERAGGSIVELGIPFSDPIADGPIIQASMARALERQVTPQQVLATVAGARAQLSIGLVAMVSYSIVYRLGPETFIADAAEAGIDGLIVPDLPLEESDAVCARAAAAKLTCSFLISPTTPLERARALARASSGFVYLVARAGVTGERAELADELPQRIEQIRAVTDLPITVGFGIANADQVREVVRVADAAIVGSAIVRRIAEHSDLGTNGLVADVESFVRHLATGLDAPAAAD